MVSSPKLAREEATCKEDTGTLNAARVTGKTQARAQYKDKTNGRKEYEDSVKISLGLDPPCNTSNPTRR